MKKVLKNEIDVLGLINQIQDQLIALNKKMDTLLAPKAPVINTAVKPHDSHKEREKYRAICADCKKECTIPFKPSGDRPVYCQDCFSRRKVIRLSGITVTDKPKEAAPVEIKKKVVAVKKPLAKKKPAPKKK